MHDVWKKIHFYSVEAIKCGLTPFKKLCTNHCSVLDPAQYMVFIVFVCSSLNSDRHNCKRKQRNIVASIGHCLSPLLRT